MIEKKNYLFFDLCLLIMSAFLFGANLFCLDLEMSDTMGYVFVACYVFCFIATIIESVKTKGKCIARFVSLSIGSASIIIFGVLLKRNYIVSLSEKYLMGQLLGVMTAAASLIHIIVIILEMILLKKKTDASYQSNYDGPVKDYDSITEKHHMTLPAGYSSLLELILTTACMIVLFVGGIVLEVVLASNSRSTLGLICFIFISCFGLFVVAIVKALLFMRPMLQLQKDLDIKKFETYIEKVSKHNLHPETRNYLHVLCWNYYGVFDAEKEKKESLLVFEPKIKNYRYIYDQICLEKLIENKEQFDSKLQQLVQDPLYNQKNTVSIRNAFFKMATSRDAIYEGKLPVGQTIFQVFPAAPGKQFVDGVSSYDRLRYFSRIGNEKFFMKEKEYFLTRYSSFKKCVENIYSLEKNIAKLNSNENPKIEGTK